MSVHMIYYKDGAKMMRPILTAAEYRNLRNGQRSLVAAIRQGDTSLKQRLIQMNYSCLPNDDGSLKGSTRLSNTVGMDIDWTPSPLPLEGEEQRAARKEEWMKKVPELVMSKKDEIGLLMLERSATKGYHLVFRRRPSMSQEENLRWASRLLGVEYDKGAKDITRVFFTTSAGPEDLLFLSPQLFELEEGKAENVECQMSNLDDTTPLPQRASANEELIMKNEELTHEEGAEKNSELSTQNSELQFRGIPYSSIIAEYWNRTGGTPVEGERNVRLHQLAVNLRAICDNKKDLLMQIMPRLGLSETELQSIVESACKEPPKGISRVMREILENEKMRNGENEGEQTDEQSSNCEIVKSSKMKLPIGLKESLIGVPESMHMPVLCAVLPIAAAYADGVEVEYCSGERMRLGLMSIIVGEQASGKSVCKRVVDIWKRPMMEEDSKAREIEQEWRMACKRRKANEKAPEDPKVLIRMVPVTVSCSTLLKRLKYAQGHMLYSFCEELDTLRKTNGAGSWSSKYDIYRVGFDQGEWGQDYNSDQAESGVVNVTYNWTILGTPGALRKCFNRDNVENGLSSRILVSEMPDGAFATMPRYAHLKEGDEERIIQAVAQLREAKGFVDTPRLRKAIARWVEEKRQEAAKNIDHIMDTYRRRAAVIGFRCGVIHFLLSQENEKLKMKNEKLNGQCSMFNVQCRESKASLDFALKIAEYCLEQQISAFGEMLQAQRENTNTSWRRNTANHSVFDQLPTLFSFNDLRMAKQGSCGEKALQMIVSRWRHDGWITKEDKGLWKKVTSNR